MKHRFTNNLINETSPYLLQHAHNPVHWNPWGEEALDKAKELDKPILVSIGYAACHWCHVMERESFENEEVAAYMNEHFINIKIDREERPDLDHIYMDAVQAITGSGGWPLNVFLTTDAKPFYGGTYFPPEKAFNRSSWMDVLKYINDAWLNRKEEIEKQAEILLDHINSPGNIVSAINPDFNAEDTENFTRLHCTRIAENMLKTADTVYGGFGAAPKFPQTFSIQYLLNYGHAFEDEKALHHAEFSLQQMLNGGIYDHVAGGMARYSTDAGWLVPHFEKMLYDNALLVSVLCDAYRLTKNKIYENAIHKTLGFWLNEMKHEAGGFFAALDADSEGVEGKFYVWDKKEIENILQQDAAIFCAWYGVTENGNWEGKNILHVSENMGSFAAEFNISVHQLPELLDRGNRKLLIERNKRERPLTDDKILLGWNALLLTALCKAAAALGDDAYKELAISLFKFIESKFSKEGIIIYHTYKNGKAKYPAFVDDYAWLIQSCIMLQEITADQQYLLKAKQMTEYVLVNFENSQNGLFYYTHKDQRDIITRKTEIYDGATASGNSSMAENLLYLSLIFDDKEWAQKAKRMLFAQLNLIITYPNSFGIWALLILRQVITVKEIIITGQKTGELHKQILQMYLPGKVFQISATEQNFPLLQRKSFGENALIYICKDHSCYPPVQTIGELKVLLQSP